jgi:predicted O-methyltransferase YrrM
MDRELAHILGAVYRLGREHDVAEPDRAARFRNIDPDSAELLAVLIRATRARRVLELGTSNGYSTIWLADATRAVGGRLTSVDIDAQRTELADENVRLAGLHDEVELVTRDAADFLATSPDGAWDLILLDAERGYYLGYWPDLVRVLAPSGLLAVDNVLSHAGEVVEFRELAAADERVIEALAPTGSGLLLIVRESPDGER